ncbi:hypothetical protein ADUPG1_005879, partial [Aduncisulcus paluster]
MGILKIGHRKIFLRNLKHLTKRFDDISSKDILPGDEPDSPELRTDEILSGSIVAEDHTPVRESTSTLVPVRLGNAQRTIKKRITTEKERREKINTDSETREKKLSLRAIEIQKMSRSSHGTPISSFSRSMRLSTAPHHSQSLRQWLQADKAKAPPPPLAPHTTKPRSRRFRGATISGSGSASSSSSIRHSLLPERGLGDTRKGIKPPYHARFPVSQPGRSRSDDESESESDHPIPMHRMRFPQL